MACARRLSKMDFDVLINLHPNERCSFIDAFTKVKLRCGTTHTLFKPLWDVFTPLNRKIHAADMYLDVLTQLGIKKLEHNGLEIFPSENISSMRMNSGASTVCSLRISWWALTSAVLLLPSAGRRSALPR